MNSIHLNNIHERRKLVELHQAHQVDEKLAAEPIKLAQTSTNALAFAHALRLSAFDFPLAFGQSAPKMDVEDKKEIFLDRDATTFGVGRGGLLQAGIIVARPLPSMSMYAASYDIPPSLNLLLRHKEDDPILMGVGKRLLAHGIDALLKMGETSVHLEVVVGNSRAQELYESLGFISCGGALARDEQSMVSFMKLPTQEAMEGAQAILVNNSSSKPAVTCL